MRYFWQVKRFPPPTRVLLVESGSRELLEKAIPAVRSFWPGEKPPMDVFTCFPGVPEGLGQGGTVYRVSDYPGAERKKLFREFKTRGYAVMGIVCSGEPILLRWKWLLAFGVNAKLLVINESGDFFWFDRENGPAIRSFLLSRSGMTGETVLRSILQFAVLPITLPYLLLFAIWAHCARAFNRMSVEDSD